jgi:hypothetical protein
MFAIIALLVCIYGINTAESKSGGDFGGNHYERHQYSHDPHDHHTRDHVRYPNYNSHHHPHSTYQNLNHVFKF